MRLSILLILLLFFSELPAQQVTGGNGHAILLNDSGEVYTMGDNPDGQQGQGDHKRLLSPQKVHLNPKGNLDNEKKEPRKTVKKKQQSHSTFDIALYLFIFLSIALNGYLIKKARKANP